MEAHHSTATTAGVAPDPNAGVRGVWLRRVVIALLAVVVVAGALDLLGVHSHTVDAASADGGTRLSVHYAAIARAGLDVPFELTVQRAGGFDGDVTVAVSAEYLDLFDRNAIDPEPSESTGTPDVVVWRFRPPPGDTLRVSVDMQVQGGRHWGKSGSVAVLDDAGDPVVRVHLTTWLAP